MILAAMHRYTITKEEKYKTASLNFYQYLLGRTFANGNHSSKATAYIKGNVSEKSEHWGAFGMLGDALTGGESESCCAHNTEKILEQLFAWSGTVDLLDHMENLKYNAVLNSSSSKTGLSQYHQPMGSHAVKQFSDEFHTFWCCTASGVEAMSELQKNIWFYDEDSLLVNAFISSVVEWKEKNLRISLQTEYPNQISSVITFYSSTPAKVRLLLKESSIKSIKINGMKSEYKKDNGLIIIHRVFQDKDELEIELNASLYLVPLQGSDNLFALKYGPLLLAQVGEHNNFQSKNKDEFLSNLKRSSREELEFIYEGEAGNGTRFLPIFQIEEEQYTVYFDPTGNMTPNNPFTSAIDGRAAYLE